MASPQGEIRIGSGHQVKLPDYHACVSPKDMPELCMDHEDPVWVPGGVPDSDLIMYLRAARSMAAFAGMCDGGSADDGCFAASRDDTTINALDTLHANNYDAGKALQALVRHPVPKRIDKKWSEDEQKRFVKGIRQYGKNFFRIRKELVPQKEVAELVNFYYLWKKTPGGVGSRLPNSRRLRRSTTLRNNKNGNRNNRTQSSEIGEASSNSDDGENDDSDSDSRELSNYSCQNCCTTTSEEWHHSGTKGRTLLCTACCTFYMKYGEQRALVGDECTFRPVSETEMGTANTAANDMPTTSAAVNLDEVKPADMTPTEVTDVVVPDDGLLGSRLNPDLLTVDSIVNVADLYGEGPIDPILLNDLIPADLSNDDMCDRSNLTPPIAGTSGVLCPLLLPDDEANTTKDPVPDTDESAMALEYKPEAGALSELETAAENHLANALVESGLPADVETMLGTSTASIKLEPMDDHETNNSRLLEDNKSEFCLSSAVENDYIKDEPVAKKPKLENTSRPQTPAEISMSMSPIAIENSSSDSGPIDQHRPLFLDSPALNASGVTGEFDAMMLMPPPSSSSTSSGNSTPQTRINPVIPDVGSDPAKPDDQPPNIIMPERSPIGTPQSPSGGFPKPVSMIKQEDMPLPLLHPHKSEPHEKLQSPKAAHPGNHPHHFEHGNEQPQLISPYHSHMPPHQSLPPHMAALYPQIYGIPFSGLNPYGGPMPPTHPQMKPPPGFYPHHLAHPGLPHPMMQPSMFSPISSPMPQHHFPPPLVSTANIPSPHHFKSAKYGPPSHLGLAPPHHGLTPTSKSQPMGIRPDIGMRQGGSGSSGDRNYDDSDDERGHHSPMHLIRGPSPEPRIDDSECHRSQSAIFLRHWNRGETNSCARTDLVFKAVPDSKLAKKREERIRRQSEKEREEREKKARADEAKANNEAIAKVATAAAAAAAAGIHDPSIDLSLLTSPPRHPHMQMGVPYDRFGRAYDTPALRQLSEYARPHAGFSPNMLPPGIRFGPGGPVGFSGFPGGPMGGFPGHCMDPLLQYQLFGSKERLEMELEREKREQENRERELRERALQEKIMEMKSPMNAAIRGPMPSPLDPTAWLDAHRRAMISAGPSSMPVHSNSSPFSIYNPAERAMAGPSHSSVPLPADIAAQVNMSARINAERERMADAERMALATDPLLRLQMAGIQPELHTHAHTHLHLHPNGANGSNVPSDRNNPDASSRSGGSSSVQSGFGSSDRGAGGCRPSSHENLPISSGSSHMQGSGGNPSIMSIPSGPDPALMFSRGPPGMLPGRDPTTLIHPGLMRQYEDQLVQQLSVQAAHEQFQRQLLMERERLGMSHSSAMAAAAAAGALHPNLIAQHEEMLRQQQREREFKVRTLEEAARGGRGPPYDHHDKR